MRRRLSIRRRATTAQCTATASAIRTMATAAGVRATQTRSGSLTDGLTDGRVARSARFASSTRAASAIGIVTAAKTRFDRDDLRHQRGVAAELPRQDVSIGGRRHGRAAHDHGQIRPDRPQASASVIATAGIDDELEDAGRQCQRLDAGSAPRRAGRRRRSAGRAPATNGRARRRPRATGCGTALADRIERGAGRARPDQRIARDRDSAPCASPGLLARRSAPAPTRTCTLRIGVIATIATEASARPRSP